MIDYKSTLNAAQLEAVTSNAPASLVIAGAGSGKTRVIVHRLAWLVEQGITPESILLLTFTRKAAWQMLDRASLLLGKDMKGIPGGTFHSFAYGGLRACPPSWLGKRSFTLLDSGDITGIIKQCKENLKAGKKDLSFPKAQTIANLLGKARNKEMPIGDLLAKEHYHLLHHAEALAEIGAAYDKFRHENGLFDYDDLLFEMERLLLENGPAAQILRSKVAHILVDEYQDTNLVQARIVRLLAGETGALTAKVMAVGDDAQSIYAFRGANVHNILDFPRIFPETAIFRLEENYRSTQPILDAANGILAGAKEAFRKKLYTSRKGGERVRIIMPRSDASQAQLVTERIAELLEQGRPAGIAVLFRSGFHSFPLENALQQAGIPFKKYGGLKFVESAHIKDVLAFARLAINPLDQPAFARICAMHKGVGPKTIERLHGMIAANDLEGMGKLLARHKTLREDFNFFDQMRAWTGNAGEFFERVLLYYRPRLEILYPDDWPSRLQGLEEIMQIASGYTSLDLLVADLALEAPDDEAEKQGKECVTLSTVHSAKGLEWDHVMVIDLVEDRFPSRHALTAEDDFEEERRLFYVACTRARDTLDIYSPCTVFSQKDYTNLSATPSPFLQDIQDADWFEEDWQGKLERRRPLFGHKAAAPARQGSPRNPLPANGASAGAYCRHKIFGRGKIVSIDRDKAVVDFQGLGTKTILCNYLEMDD